MRPSPKLLLRGVLKLVAVVAAASLAGVGIGAGLAKLSGDSSPPAPVAATSAAPRTAPTRGAGRQSSTQPASTTATKPPPTSAKRASTTAQPAAVQGTADPEVDIEVLSARLGPQSNTTGHARVRAEVRVTNRATTPLQITTALLLSGDDEVKLDYGARDAAAALLSPIAPGADVTATVRFTVATGVAQRLLAKLTAHMRIADKTVELRLQSAQATTTATTTTG